VTIRVRLGHGVARLAPAPLVTLDLEPGATVADACDRLAGEHPRLAPALPGVLAVVGGAQVSRAHPLRAGDELALLMPLSGG
jgi:molybdopterin synthase catalytic subunit/molybdopterin synthase sulfur carrier subunit